MSTAAGTYTIQAAADLLGISRTHCGNLARNGALPGGIRPIRLGSRLVIARDDLDTYLAGARTATAPAVPDLARVQYEARVVALRAELDYLLAHAPRPATPGDRPGAGGEQERTVAA